MSKTISARLVKALSRINRPGAFCTSGSVPAVLPGLKVDGIGYLGMPMPDAQVANLQARCEQAPYGKGEKTLVNTAVRRVWRLRPEHFTLANPAWIDFIAARVAEVASALGLQVRAMEAHLYELLLYETGGFFLPHKDGEKLDRMVATMVIVLPSEFEGGQLVVRHEGQEQLIDFAAGDPRFNIQFAAFYADCEHEVKPLLSGHRLALIYNLVLTKSKAAVSAPRTSDHVDEIADVLREWKESAAAPNLLAVTLGHEYTKDGLEWDTLKGVDRSKADILAQAAAKCGFHAYLALLTFWETGSVEGAYDDDYGRRGRYGRNRSKENASKTREISEVFDSSLTAENWRSPDGGKPLFGAIPVDEDQVAPRESLTAIKPEEDFEGYTGNAGMTLERWYRHAAICLWPDEKHFDVLCQVGSREALPALEQMVKQWRKAAEPEASELKSRCLAFARKIISQWPAVEFRSARRAEMASDAPDPMFCLNLLDDKGLIHTFLAETLAKDANLDPGAATVKVLARHGWSVFLPDIVRLFGATTNQVLERNARFLEDICVAAMARAKKQSADAIRKMCREPAGAILNALQKIDTSNEKPEWRSQQIDRTPMLASLVRALLAIKLDDLLQEVVLLVQSFPESYPLRGVQLPALHAIGKEKGTTPAPLLRWIASCVDQLQSLTAVRPEPPADFRREDRVMCKCKDCAELKNFLVDPARREWPFRAAVDRRRHVESEIGLSKSDIACKTVKNGSPHILMCTKNTASYERQLKHYHEDLKSLGFVRSMK